MPTMEQTSFPTIGAFVVALNSFRLKNKNKWIWFAGEVQGMTVSLKSYNTGYLQIFRINGREQAAPMDMKPMIWKSFIINALKAGIAITEETKPAQRVTVESIFDNPKGWVK